MFYTTEQQSLKNCRLISLLPIFGKSFERIIYNTIFEYLTTNELTSDNQSGFKPGDSCVNQLLSITHEIYQSLDNGLEVIGVFLDILKAFDKVWHEGLTLKLNQYGILENLLCLIKCFLKNRTQFVVLNVQTAYWTNVLAGVPQGSTLIFSWYILMIYQMTYPPILNYLQIVPLFFQLYTTKTLQQKNLIMTYGKLVTGAINEKWVSTPTLSNKLRR